MVRLSTLLAVVFMLAFSLFAQAEEEERAISGTVTDVDWVSSAMTVRYYDIYTRSMDEITIRVPKEARITRGTKTISFSDIRQSDQVSVNYYSDDLSGFKAKRISDQNRGNR